MRYLHDIGKLLVPNEILSKPDRLTANEYAIIKEHVNLGYQIVKDADIDERVKSAIYYTMKMRRLRISNGFKVRRHS